MMLITTGNPVL